MGVHIVHQVGQLGILEAVVAEQLADVAPVVLFDGGIGVVLVGAERVKAGGVDGLRNSAGDGD